MSVLGQLYATRSPIHMIPMTSITKDLVNMNQLLKQKLKELGKLSVIESDKIRPIKIN